MNFPRVFAMILDITPVHSSSETLHEKTLTRDVVAPVFVGRIGSADHGTGRTAERGELSLAHPDRRIRSAARVGGWQPALLCALAELQVRVGSGSGTREGARGERAAGGAEDCRRHGARRTELFESARVDAGSDPGYRGELVDDRAARHGLPCGEG